MIHGRATQKYKPIEGDNESPYLQSPFHTILTGDDGTNQRISWGEPAVRTQVKMDKECPQCGLSRADGFDMGVERGRVFGARCPREDGGCGWSF